MQAYSIKDVFIRGKASSQWLWVALIILSSCKPGPENIEGSGLANTNDPTGITNTLSCANNNLLTTTQTVLYQDHLLTRRTNLSQGVLVTKLGYFVLENRVPNSFVYIKSGSSYGFAPAQHLRCETSGTPSTLPQPNPPIPSNDNQQVASECPIANVHSTDLTGLRNAGKLTQGQYEACIAVKSSGNVVRGSFDGNDCRWQNVLCQTDFTQLYQEGNISQKEYGICIRLKTAQNCAG